MAKDTYIPRDEVVAMHIEFNKVRKKAEKELKALPGVLSVGVGLKEVKGELQRELCFKVTVEKKKAKKSLQKKDMVPETIYGFKTDVDQMETGVSFMTVDKKTYRPLVSGCRMENSENSETGTVGCFAKQNGTGKIVLLSNWHTMVDSPDTIDGENIGQPSHNGWCSCCASNEIGKVIGGSFRADHMDAAIALLDGQEGDSIPEYRYLNEILEIGYLAGSTSPVGGETVYKRGYLTGLQKGVISNDNMTSRLIYKEYDNLLMVRDDQMEITPRELIPGVPFPDFALQGDSGSVVVNENNQAVGLLYGGLLPTHKTHATDITRIELKLEIEILDSTFHSHVAGKTGVPLTSVAAKNTQLSLNEALATLESEIGQFKEGKRLLEFFKVHRKELLDLVRHRREVIAAWHRYQGPAYLSHIARSVRRDNKPIPEQILGISLQSLLLKMTVVLQRNGSPELAKAVQDNYLQIMNLLSSGRTPDEWKAHLAKMESEILISNN